MLTSISPLGERARGHRWGTTVTFYIVGSLLGGATIGALLGAVGSPLPTSTVVLLVAAAVCAVAAVAEAMHRLPTLRRQVDENWLVRYRSWVYAVGFGYQLGLGIVTIVTSAATYAALALCLFSGSVAGGLAIGACFGLVRALPLLRLRTARSPEQLRAAAARLEALTAGASRATTVVLAAAAVALALGAGAA